MDLWPSSNNGREYYKKEYIFPIAYVYSHKGCRQKKMYPTKTKLAEEGSFVISIRIEVHIILY
jgi:hypothetical protein